MNPKSEMESYLEMTATLEREIDLVGLPALLLEKGSWFEGRADSDEYAAAKQWKMKWKPKAQDCFYNSQEFCTKHDGARYFEGFVHVQEGLPPSEHAWVVMQDSRVVDFTLEAVEVAVAEKGHTVDLRGSLYVGLEVPRAAVVKRLAQTEWYQAIAEHFYAEQIKRIAGGGD
jgi:hypothetical protein